MRQNSYRSEVLQRLAFSDADKRYLTAPKFLAIHENSLRGAVKLSGMIPAGTHCFSPFPYFDSGAFPPGADIGGGHVDLTREIILERIDRCIISTPNECPRWEDQFTCTIEQDSAAAVEIAFEKAFALFCWSAHLWQHFMQDALHFLYFARPFLLAHPEIPILLNGVEHESIIGVIKGQLGLLNPIVQFPRPGRGHARAYGVGTLYLARFLPDSHLFSCAPKMRRLINQHLSAPKMEKDRLLYMSREGRSLRKVRNEASLVSALQQFARSRSLQFSHWDPERHSLDETVRAAQAARIFVAMHGGANYHVYWMSPGCSFIELVCTQPMESLMSIACSIGLDYWMVPVDGGHYSSEVTVNVEQVSQILKELRPSP